MSRDFARARAATARIVARRCNRPSRERVTRVIALSESGVCAKVMDMLAVALTLMLAQPRACGPETATFMDAATRLAEEFDLKTAASGFELAALRGCEQARVFAPPQRS